MSILDFFRPDKRLQQQIAQLEEENRRLKKAIEAAASGYSPSTHSTQEDFASAVSSALDSLQAQMSQMSNKVSDFAVREVSLQAKVSLEVTPLGTLNYRLVRPEEPIDAQKISTLSLTVVPVPKPEGYGTLKPSELNPQVGVDELKGIGDAQRARLYRNNIYTVGEFLQVGTRARSAVQLAALLEVDRQRLGEIMAHAQLLMLNGIDSQMANILYSAGIRGFNDIASLTQEELVSRYERRARELGEQSPGRISPTKVKTWIETVRTYIGMSGQPVDIKSDN